MAKQVKLIVVPIIDLAQSQEHSDGYTFEKEEYSREKNITALENALNDGWSITQADTVFSSIVYMLIKEDKAEED